MLFRDHQKVNGRLRIDIVKGEYLVIFVYLLGRNLSVDDLAEQTIHAALLGFLGGRQDTAVFASVPQAIGLALSGRGAAGWLRGKGGVG
ncbi:hypothetical protein ULG90_20180 [Halopseudomonas pachastrellae]|nr:hypothetical protein ULG90_20180 [Halopseudomonas pachastrellae]